MLNRCKEREKNLRKPEIVLYSDTHTVGRTKDVQPAHVHISAHRARVTARVGERRNRKKSVFESKQRQSDQDQIDADQTVVLK